MRFVQSAIKSSGVKDDLTYQRLAERWSDDAVGAHEAVAEMYGQGTGHRSFLLSLVRIRHDRGPPGTYPETLDDVLGQNQHDRSRIDDRFDARTADVGFPAVSSLEKSSVSRILQLDVDGDFSHVPALGRP